MRRLYLHSIICGITLGAMVATGLPALTLIECIGVLAVALLVGVAVFWRGVRK